MPKSDKLKPAESKIGISPEVIDRYVTALGKKIPVYKRGHGSLPLLVIGQATLFLKPGLIPSALDEHFTLYFVDMFEKSTAQVDCSKIALTTFVDAIEKVRMQLGLEKIAIFAHSSTGILAIEYAAKYPTRAKFNIIVGTSPIRGEYKDKFSQHFFKHNATKERQVLFDADQKALAAEESKKQFSHRRYDAARAHFYFTPLMPFWQNLWTDINTDEILVNHYFSLIKDYDIRKSTYRNVPGFNAMGLYDYSFPYYLWSDECRSMLGDYFIFTKSAHFPPVEEPELFVEELLKSLYSQLNLTVVPRSKL